MVDLPKLFDRNFVIGFFLPLAVFLAAAAWFAEALGVYRGGKALVIANPFLSGFLVWLGAVLLLGVNRQIVRALEGYGRYNPIRLWHVVEVRRYKSFHKRLDDLNDRFFCASEEEKELIRSKRSKLLAVLSERFPGSLEHVLPTAFGNVLRAFESYPRIIYGFEGVCGWSRLLAVVPKDYRDLIDSARAQVDFWLNAWALSSFFCFVSIGAIASSRAYRLAPFAAGAALVWWISSRCSRTAAAGWGEMVKAAFDVFLPTLRIQLGYKEEMTRAEERELWVGFSNVMTFRLQESLPEAQKSHEKKPILIERLWTWLNSTLSDS